MRQVQSAQMEHMSSLKSDHEVEINKRMTDNTNLEKKIEDMSKEHANNSANYDKQFRSLNDKCKKEIFDLNTIKKSSAMRFNEWCYARLLTPFEDPTRIWNHLQHQQLLEYSTGCLSCCIL